MKHTKETRKKNSRGSVWLTRWADCGAKFSKKPTKKPAPKKLKGKKKIGNRLRVVILNVAVFQAK
jgi:hypothetical protein